MNTGPAPYKLLTANTAESGQRSSFWVVAVCSFSEPAAMYSPGKLRNPVETKQLIIIENDAIGVSINGSKDSFGEMANINLKSTDVYYPALVHTGDWLFVWMFDTQNKADACVTLLNTVSSGGSVGTKLCDYQSGLKHIGRVTAVQSTDSVSANGVRTINQSIQSQAFLEFATSVYYTYNPGESVSAVASPSNIGSGVLSYVDAVNLNFQTLGLDRALSGLADKFLSFYRNAKDNSEFTPDNLIALYFILIMGVDSDAQINNSSPVKGTVNDSIVIPSLVASIMGVKAKRLWELYNLVLGVQTFKKDEKNWYKSFAPITTDDTKLTKKSAMRCKGFVPFRPTMWSNQSMWSILTEYLNPVCNEMFTSLRLDKNGVLRPTLTVREKPFTTGLFGKFTPDGKIDPSLTAKVQGSSSIKEKKNPITEALKGGSSEAETTTEMKPSITFGSAFQNIGDIAGSMGKSAKEATHFATVPRWVIDPSIVVAFDWSTDEAQRVNFVQVFGRAAAPEFAGAANVDQGKLKQSQYLAGNYIADEADIARNGLRAHIEESPFDILSGDTVSGSLAPLWARMNADWLFNGHLKANGSITLKGVWEPIAKGDNLQYNGILFHIEGISHTATNSNGIKTWTTTISLSRGILADSMRDTKSVPIYPAHASTLTLRRGVPGPGFSTATNRISDAKSVSTLDLMKKVLK